MSRRKERLIMKVMGLWQIIDGVFTIIFYGFVKTGFIGLFDKSFVETPYSSATFIFICSFGMVLIVLGLINILLSKQYVKDGKKDKKIGVYLLIQSLFSYFILDVISLVLGMCAGVVYLAKNKSIRLNKC